MFPVMARKHTADKIKWFRGRAEEVRAAGENMKIPQARAVMLQLAETYERVANSLELVLGKQERSGIG